MKFGSGRNVVFGLSILFGLILFGWGVLALLVYCISQPDIGEDYEHAAYHRAQVYESLIVRE